MAAATVVYTLILGSVVLFFAHIANILGPKRPLTRSRPNSTKDKSPMSRQSDRGTKAAPARSGFNSIETQNADRVGDWLSSSENSDSPAPDDDSNATKRWLLTPKNTKFPPTARLRSKGRWEGKPDNIFFPTRGARTKPRGKVQKPVLESRRPNKPEKSAPIRRKPTDGLSPWPKNDPLHRIPELPKDALTRHVSLPMDKIDAIYDHLCTFLAVNSFAIGSVTAGNLRWAAERTHTALIDWDNYLEYREQRADAQERLKQAEQKLKTRDPYSLTKSQLSTLLGIDYSNFSIEDVYYAIAASTARPNPTVGFLTTISQTYQIRTDIDWPDYLEYYLYRVKSPTTKSRLEEPMASPSSRAKPSYAMDNKGRPIDILGNQIEYARNKVGNLTPELEIELTMSGGLQSNDIHFDEPTKHRLANIWAETSTIADPAADLLDNVQPLRLIKGSKLPKFLWERRRNVFTHINQPFIDALQSLDPPVRLDQYFITKAALLRVLALKEEVIFRQPEIVNLRNTPRAQMSEEQQDILDNINQNFNMHTTRLLIAFGGRMQTSEEAQAVNAITMYGLEYASFPECLKRMKMNDWRLDRSEEEEQYWKSLDAQVDEYWSKLWGQASEYWQSISDLVEAPRIVYQREDTSAPQIE